MNPPKSTKDADDDVHEGPIASAAHDFACEPTCNETHYNPPN